MRELFFKLFAVTGALAAALSAGAQSHMARAESRIVVLDATNSMWGPIKGGRKYQIARDAITSAANGLTADTSLGLYVLGNQSGAGCDAIRETLPLGPPDRGRLDRAFESANPDAGRMPLFPAIESALKAIKASGGEGRILFIGDGAGSCVPDTCAAARGLKERAGGVRIDAVSLDADADTRKRLQCITDSSGGSYLNAGSRAEVVAFVQASISGSTAPAAPRPRPRAARADAAPPAPAANPFRPGQSPKVKLRAILSKGSEPIKRGLAWRVMEGGSGEGEGREVWRGAGAEPEINLPKGRYRVEARHGLITATREIEVRPRRAQTITVNLDAAVLKLSAAPRPGAEPMDGIFYYVEALDERAGQPLVARASRAQPSFTLPAGRYRVVARHGLAEAADTVDLEAGAILGRNLALNTGTIRVKAMLTAGDAAPPGVLFHVYARGTDGAWREMLRSALLNPTLALPEGEYRIEASLDAASADITERIAAGETREAIITLRAGQLRLETRLEERSEPEDSDVVYQVFRLADAGPELIHMSAQAQFEGFLPEGRYRVTSSYGVGNAAETQEVTIEAGQTHNLSFVHKAGRAQLGLVKVKGGITLARVNWSIRNSDGQEVYRSTETIPEPYLRAGQYVAIAQRQGRTVRQAFTIAPNRTTVVELVEE